MTSQALVVDSQVTSARKMASLLKEAGSTFKRTDAFTAHCNDIDFRPEWNIRPIDREHVEELKNAISRGETIDPLELQPVMVDGRPVFHIVDGHHSFVAYDELYREGKHDGLIPASLFQGSEQDKLVRAFNSTQGLALTPIQAAKTFQRMLDEGMSKKEISERTGKKLPYISNTLFLLNADDKMMKMIDSGLISPSRAGRIMRENGEAATAIAIAEVQMRAGGVSELEGVITTEQSDSQEISSPESAEGEQNNTPATQQSAPEQPQRKSARKNGMQFRKLSTKRQEGANELLLKLDRNRDGNTVQLTDTEITILSELANELNEIKQHNRNVTDRLAEINS